MTVLYILVSLVALKAMVIGSDLNFYHLFKYGREYWHWYSNRPKFLDG
jgi:hypothetical protein